MKNDVKKAMDNADGLKANPSTRRGRKTTTELSARRKTLHTIPSPYPIKLERRGSVNRRRTTGIPITLDMSVESTVAKHTSAIFSHENRAWESEYPTGRSNGRSDVVNRNTFADNARAIQRAGAEYVDVYDAAIDIPASECVHTIIADSESPSQWVGSLAYLAGSVTRRRRPRRIPDPLESTTM